MDVSLSPKKSGSESPTKKMKMSPMYEVREISKNNMGTFASRRIPKGTLLFDEYPIYRHNGSQNSWFMYFRQHMFYAKRIFASPCFKKAYGAGVEWNCPLENKLFDKEDEARWIAIRDKLTALRARGIDDELITATGKSDFELETAVLMFTHNFARNY